jgi:hypothetical protein
MLFRSPSSGAARLLAVVFAITTVLLAAALAATWSYTYRLYKASTPPPPPLLQALGPNVGSVSPLQVDYRLDVPGRGEIFPALSGGRAADYWPAAVLTISNSSDRPMAQVVSAEIPGWSLRTEHTLIVGARSSQRLDISPELLPRAYDNQEMRRATLDVYVRGPQGAAEYFQRRPLYLHSASDLYWGRSFSNAQFIARWVTPHDPAVLRLVAAAKRYATNGRLPGYNPPVGTHFSPARQVRSQAEAVFEALKRSGISYVSSIYTFGNFTSAAQRIRLPEETLTLSTANCIDVSVAFASAIENLGMDPVVVVVPGHAFTGVRLAPQSQERLYLDLTVLPKGNFQQAITRAQKWMKTTPADRVLVIDIAAARALRIYPIPIPQPERRPNVAQSSLAERSSTGSAQ